MIQKQDVLLKDWLLQYSGRPISREDLIGNQAYFEQNRKNFTKEGRLNFANSSFKGQDLRGVNLKSFDMSWCKIEGAKVDRDGFEYILSYYKKGTIEIRGVDIKGLDLSGMDLDNLDFEGVDFSNTTIDRGIIIALIDDVKIGRVSIKYTNISGIDLRGAFIHEPVLGLAGFEYFDLADVDLEGCNLSGADLSGARLDGVNFTGANLEGVKMQASYARNAIFSHANMRSAILCSTDFTNAIFDNADLTGAEV